MKKNFKRFLFSTLLFTMLGSSLLLAQNNSQYQLAERFMQQQEYQEALPILQELHENNPENFTFANRLIDCSIQLKQYDEALTIAEKFKENENVRGQVNIRIGELYHYKGEEDQALEIWKSNLTAHSNQLQLYVNTAQTMINRREYMEAVEIYKKARNSFNNQQIFFSDIANAYMQAGEYELAINEWLALLQDNPNQISYIQRSLLRYNDPILYDITIVELNDRLSEMSVNNELYQTYYQLQSWLLLENNLFRRALAAAKEFENRTENFNYSLFNIGQKLVNNNEFELAVEAFSYYSGQTDGEVKWRSFEELADTYSTWAKFIDDYNLDFTNRRDSLYRLATEKLDAIENETTTYSRMNNVHLKRAELALDYVFDLEKAESSLEKLKSLVQEEDTPEVPYLEGRIHLAKKEFSQARIFLTRSNKQAEIGEIAEKTRYFLALTDFYAGDFEFSTIQLKTLGRNNTSYYANDALELRLWLQDGQSVDTTGQNLTKFAEAVFKFNNGEPKESAQMFSEITDDPSFVTLKDDAILYLAKSTEISPKEKFIKISNFLSSGTPSPIREKLMWEQAKLSEQLDKVAQLENCSENEECLETTPQSTREIYEELILSYPQGFYAPYARERLNNLSNPTS
ncbi:tetratricopeptide repeat protein [Gracilimonas sp.]|uniref:tetratricopeptide repeat protein n=1 Tax=Gracilimonas sp. TaxID=1974203 RepID=UPI0028712868|nr:tetratricopeptide repeat protein [Gracilimonas sp.]